MFPVSLTPDANGLAFIGGDLALETITEAYGRGLFPWRGGKNIPWYLPAERAVLQPGAMHVAHRLAKRAARGELTVAFDRDARGAQLRCATTPRAHEKGTWITPDMVAAYDVLRERGIAHSVEIYREGEPVGGLYGLTFGRLFHGESMYFREPDASKLALWALSEALAARGFALIDCQGATPHLLSLGAKVWPSARYLEALTLNRTAPSLHESWRDWTVTCLPARS